MVSFLWAPIWAEPAHNCPNGPVPFRCSALYAVLRDPSRPVPLWDVELGEPELEHFRPHAAWSDRAGRQYMLDQSLFGLPRNRTVDLNVFDPSFLRELDAHLKDHGRQ